jgi:hypothetical protein
MPVDLQTLHAMNIIRAVLIYTAHQNAALAAPRAASRFISASFPLPLKYR